MLTSRSVKCLLLLVVITLGTAAFGQDYPNKPIRIIATAGGSNELKARLIAQGISGPIGQAVIVETRPTAIISAETVAKAPSDGYTLHVCGSSLWLTALMQKVPYDPVRDFSPISYVDRSSTALAVHPSLPVKSVKDLISLAKARPGELNYSSAGAGNSGWFAMELLKSMAGVNILSVPYKNLAQSLTAAISGEVQATFADPALVLPHAKAGRLRAVAVTSATPSALAPGLPTMAASGLPGYEYSSGTFMFAPAKTPDAAIRRLNQEVVRFLSNPDTKLKLLDSGIEAVSSPPEEVTATIKTEITKMGKLLKDAGLRVE